MLIVIRLSSTKRLDDGLVPKCCVARLFLFEASAPGLEGMVFSLRREVGAILTYRWRRSVTLSARVLQYNHPVSVRN